MNLLVTAGPTREFIDSVRFLSNPSSGKMGYAVAAAAARRGHDVALVSGPVAISEPEKVTVIHVVSAREMFDAVMKRFPECDAVVMTAAVCDYRPVKRHAQKLAKQNLPRTLDLEPTADILAALGVARIRQALIGFAMEDHDQRKHAEEKLRRKGCDAIVLNGPENVGADHGSIEILRPRSEWSLTHTGSKAFLADIVVTLAERIADELAPR
jgi:phosphopantothenoylcysteine decarboxylase/phosphopantothenate--cysteine ligase